MVNTHDISLSHAASATVNAQRIVVVAGAGISTAADIPDFKSKALSSNRNNVKELFSANVYRTSELATQHRQLVAELATAAARASPTAFHRLLKSLDDDGKLLRVYTQNIDGLELKAGLSCGLDETSVVIPLHGQVDQLMCTRCCARRTTSEYIRTLSAGHSIDCPECVTAQQARMDSGLRQRGVGQLKPNIVLYDEPHRQAETIEELLDADIKSRPDLLLVVGTSLRIPGVVAMIRRLSKAVATSNTTIRTVYIGYDEPPCKLAQLFDIVLLDDIDAFARAV